MIITRIQKATQRPLILKKAPSEPGPSNQELHCRSFFGVAGLEIFSLHRPTRKVQGIPSQTNFEAQIYIYIYIYIYI